MPTDPAEITDDEVRRIWAQHLERLADQVVRLARMLPGDRVGDGSVIRIVQPSTRRVSLMPEAPQELLNCALALAARGYHLFPVCAATFKEHDKSNGKTPLIKGWPERATSLEAIIHGWWGDEFRGANLGIATGETSGLTVVDLDYRDDKDGPAQLAALERIHGELPRGPRVWRGASRHLYFGYVAELHNVNGALVGVDVKNDRGYVVAPRSIHKSGDRYEFEQGTEDLELPRMPDWLIEVLRTKPAARMERKVRTARSPREMRTAATPSGQPIAIGIESDDMIAPSIADRLRGSITVDDVLAAHDLPTTPCACPLHPGADNDTAFKSYADGWRWRCWTRWEEDDDSGEHDGDVIDLIRHLTDCTFNEAVAIAEGIAATEGKE